MNYKEMEAELANAKPASFDMPAAAPWATALKGIINGIAPTISALEQRVEQLEQRLAEVERKGYVGVWKDGKEYSPQSECTHDGARWICHKRTADKPGTSADWSMMEKSAPTSSPRSDASTVNPRVNGHYARPRSP